jgi:hypothetical protein
VAYKKTEKGELIYRVDKIAKRVDKLTSIDFNLFYNHLINRSVYRPDEELFFQEGKSESRIIRKQ